MSEADIASQSDTFPMPKQGFTCFFCGDTFTTPGSARLHFGADPLKDAACRIKAGAERGILMELRRAEEELERYRADDCNLARDLHAMQSRHSAALRSAEELGYERGLADGIKLGNELLASEAQLSANEGASGQASIETRSNT